jgi:flavin-dependent dehydrogenase
MASTREVEVCIVGGGPAGAVLARRLAGLGHAVLVVERNLHTSRVRGETLHAGAWPLLDHLGITRDVLDTGARSIHRSLVRWGDDEVAIRAHDVPQLAVLRPRLDVALLELARRAGATVLQPATFTGATRAGDGWAITVEHGDELVDVRAQVVADASGRDGWRQVPRAQTSARTLAMRGLWSGPALPSEARAEALDDGWLWGAPAAADRYAVTAIVEADTPLGLGRYLTALGASRLFRQFDARATLVEDLVYNDATGHAPRAGCEDRLFRLGDASYSLDPLSTAGIPSALGSAIHASAAIHTLLLHPERSALVRRFYEDARRAEMARHRAAAARLYAECRWRTDRFWDHRTTPQPAPAPAPAAETAPAFDPATTHVALSAGVSLQEMPYIAGDVIEPRLGVTSAARDRPFVWIAGVAIAPLVAPLVTRPMTPGELVATWRHVPPARHQELLEWLLREQIVRPVAAHGTL